MLQHLAAVEAEAVGRVHQAAHAFLLWNALKRHWHSEYFLRDARAHTKDTHTIHAKRFAFVREVRPFPLATERETKSLLS